MTDASFPFPLSFFPPAWSESILHRSDQSFICWTSQRLHKTHSHQIFPSEVRSADIVLWVILDITRESLRNCSVYLSQTNGRAGDGLQLEELTRGSMSLHGFYGRSSVVLLAHRLSARASGLCAVVLMFCYSGGDVNSVLARNNVNLCLAISLSLTVCLTHTPTCTLTNASDLLPCLSRECQAVAVVTRTRLCCELLHPCWAQQYRKGARRYSTTPAEEHREWETCKECFYL